MEEPITEWPPPTAVAKENGDQEASRKRRKVCDGIEEESRKISRWIQSSPSIKADGLLARWWKDKIKTGGDSMEIGIKSINPNTILFHVSKLSSAKDFLRSRIDFLLSLLRDASDAYDVNFSLATCYHLLGAEHHCTAAALQHAQDARRVAAKDCEEVEWLIQVLERQKAVEERKEEGKKKLERIPLEELKMLQFTQVERRSSSSISCTEFYDKYVLTHTPVILTDLVEKMTTRPWTLEYIKKVIGHKKAPLKRVVSGSIEWAQLECAGESQVGAFIDSLDHQKKDSLSFLFDWSLPLNCPDLMKDLKIPDYFTDNYLQKTPEGSLYRDSWPSLFVAPAGITSGLHVDAFGSNFWMALFEGRKRWIFFPPGDLPYLSPIYHNSTDAIFEVDLSDLEDSNAISSHPLLALTHPLECVLCAGEVLFVPASSPHRVENLDKSLAISANFVNSSNFEIVKKELRVNGLLDPRAHNLLSIFEGSDFKNDCTHS